jgi:hypothetical protein
MAEWRRLQQAAGDSDAGPGGVQPSSGLARQPVSIIASTSTEAEHIPTLVRRVFAAMNQTGIAAVMVIVDKDSGDGSDRAVQVLAGAFAVRLIPRRGERGLSSAVVRCFQEAKHDVLVGMRVDLSHPPQALPQSVTKPGWESLSKRGAGRWRRLPSHGPTARMERAN